jgi:hypothetical protein
MRVRQRKLDVGFLSALGATIRDGLREYGIEIRLTAGLRNLTAGDVVFEPAPYRSHTISILGTSATRVF